MKVRNLVLALALLGVVFGPATAQEKHASPAGGRVALSREQILKQGPEALEKHCVGCHLADKWEGTSRDRDGWSAIVTEMAKLMDTAGKPKMDDKTFDLIVDYLTLTHPQ